MDDVRSLFDDARARLAGAPREGLGRMVEPRRILGIARAPRIVPVGSAWHLGVLLVGDAAVMSVGEVTRAVDPGRRGYAAESARHRAELRAAALRGGFAAGDTVHFGWTELDLDAVARGEESGPLSLVSGEPMVRWSASGTRAPLRGYLDERIEMLRHPIQGA
ncbi:MAG TPA: glutaminase [Microbacterium sp.]|uniref:glutaminase n=1 Tax=Microbacterium sp. TaxID=51671 RepID=UPI002BFDA250|nr:glutaminase [Microbacterium sp.]HWI31222.1 glutaminase [Microbacterium sp.]